MVLLLVSLGVLAYQATRTALALRDAQQSAERLQSQLADGAVEPARSSAEELQRSADVARRSSDGWLWSATTVLPGLGDDAAAVQALAAGLDDVGRAAPGAVDVVGRVVGGQLRTDDGRVDLDVVRSVAGPLADLSAGAQRASERVADVEPDGLVGPLAAPAADFVDRLETLRASARGAAAAAEVLPDLLGGDGERTYLLVLQNNAEIRGTGGLPGSVGVLTADDGRVRLSAQGAAGDFQGPPGSYADLEPGEREVFGPLLVREFRDAGFTPDFPRAASLWAGHAEAARDRSFDGVVSLDPVTLSQVLRATGPIEAAGQELGPDNALRELLYEPYVRFPEPTRQDAFFRAAAGGIFDALLQARGDQSELVRVLAEATTQRRLQFWTDDAAVQDRLAGFAVSGTLPRDERRPEVGLYLDDATGAKIQYFLRHEAEISSLGCRDGRQLVESRMRLTSDITVPVGELPVYVTGNGSLAPKGNSRMLLRIFAPPGGALTALEIDGEATTVAQDEVYGRQVTQQIIELAPGQEMEVAAQFESAPGATGDPRLQWTPGMEWGATQDVAASRCAP